MKNGEKSFSKLFDLLEHIARNGSGCSGKELSEFTGIPSSTVFRMLKFMADREYVHSDHGSYTLGTALVRLGNAARHQNPLIKSARPVLEELSLQTKETVHLAQLQGDRIVYIDKVEGNRLIRMASLIGKTGPLYCTGIGKAILAFLPEAQQKKLLSQLEYRRYTDNTITTESAMREELAIIRQQGCAIDNCEHENGVCCLAAPILNSSNECVAGISISGAEMYMKDHLPALASLVSAAARRISDRL